MIDAGAIRDLYGRLTKLERELERRRVEVHGAPILRLNYLLASDVQSGAAWTAGTFFDLISAQSFTVGSANSLILVLVSLGVQAINSTGAIAAATRLNVDDTTVYEMGVDENPTTGNPAFPSGGNAFEMTLSAGSHSIRPQLYTGQAALVYLRPVSSPYEWLRMQVLELPR